MCLRVPSLRYDCVVVVHNFDCLQGLPAHAVKLCYSVRIAVCWVCRSMAIEQTNVQAREDARAGANIEKLGKDGLVLNMDPGSPAGPRSFQHGQVRFSILPSLWLALLQPGLCTHL